MTCTNIQSSFGLGCPSGNTYVAWVRQLLSIGSRIRTWHLPSGITSASLRAGPGGCALLPCPRLSPATCWCPVGSLRAAKDGHTLSCSFADRMLVAPDGGSMSKARDCCERSVCHRSFVTPSRSESGTQSLHWKRDSSLGMPTTGA